MIIETKLEVLEGCFLTIVEKIKNMSSNNWFSFIKQMGECIKNSYLPIVKREKTLSITMKMLSGKIFEEEGMLNSIFYMIKELYLA